MIETLVFLYDCQQKYRICVTGEMKLLENSGWKELNLTRFLSNSLSINEFGINNGDQSSFIPYSCILLDAIVCNSAILLLILAHMTLDEMIR